MQELADEPPMKKVLITGITGFAGSYLAEYLVAKRKHDVFGTYLLDKSVNNVNAIKKDIKLFRINLLFPKETDEVVKAIKPDLVFHLAALPSAADSFKAPQETLTNNINAQVNILNAIRINNLLDTRILVTSSADIYGLVKKEDLPIDEGTSFMPVSPYAVSKIAQDFLALQYFLAYKLKIVRVRPFNHIGPRQSANFVVPSFAQKIAQIEKGKREPILRVGDLESKRDFTDVRDMVCAYNLGLEKGEPGDVYNIGSGGSYKIYDILNSLLLLSKIKIAIKKDKSLLRPTDIPELVCDAGKFKRLTNWKPKIDINTTLKNTLDYWRNIV